MFGINVWLSILWFLIKYTLYRMWEYFFVSCSHTYSWSGCVQDVVRLASPILQAIIYSIIPASAIFCLEFISLPQNSGSSKDHLLDDKK